MRVLYTLLLVLAASAAPAVAAEPADIPRVKNLAELEACEPADAGNGWSVRLGYGEPGAASGGPWVVLYCLAEPTDHPPRDGLADDGAPGTPLGPVWYTLEGPGCPKMLLGRMRQSGFAISATSVPLLWCATMLPRSATMAQTLTALGAGDRVLAKHTFEKPKAARPYLWHQFAVPKPKDEQPRGAGSTVAADAAHAAYPLFGPIPLALPGPDARATAADDEAPPPTGLPGLVGDGDAEGLRLSLNDGVFVIVADQFMADCPDEYLLARWWVNGEPVVAPVADRQLAEQASRQVDRAKEIRVAFGLPDHLPALKADDKLALQILYAPGGSRRVPPEGRRLEDMKKLQQFIRRDDAARPLLSNRLEFEVTEGMLRKADPAKPADAAE